jgi:hypothetical protein
MVRFAGGQMTDDMHVSEVRETLEGVPDTWPVLLDLGEDNEVEVTTLGMPRTLHLPSGVTSFSFRSHVDLSEGCEGVWLYAETAEGTITDMTVSVLRRLVADVPDDWPVMLMIQDSDGHDWCTSFIAVNVARPASDPRAGVWFVACDSVDWDG